MTVIEKPVDRTQFLSCQTSFERHWWESTRTSYRPRTSFDFWKIVSYECTKCFTVKHIAVDREYGVVFTRYVYPKGYSYTRDERPTPQEFRRMLLRRRLSGGKKQQLKAVS